MWTPEQTMTNLLPPQVTHNPDLECYADRILYVEDGQFKREAVNESQCRINYDSYMKYMSSLKASH